MARRDIDRLQEEIEELFADLWQVPRFSGLRHGFRPNVDCFHTDDPQQPALVGRCGAARVDVDRERHLTLERPVLDLAAVPDLVVRARSWPFAGEHEPASVQHDPDRVRVGTGDLDDDGELGRVLRANDVDLRPVHEPGARGEPRHLPEVGKELLELGQPVDVAPAAPGC